MIIKRKDSSATLGMTRGRNLLAVILTALLAVLFVLAAVPYISKNLKTARADVAEEKDTLAQILGYADFSAMSTDLVANNDKTFNVTDFGATTVTFGGMEWWPVYTYGSEKDVVLTLFLKTSVGNYSFSDGTHGRY